MSGTVAVTSGAGVETTGAGVETTGAGVETTGLELPEGLRLGDVLKDVLGLALLVAPAQPADTGAVPIAAMATGVTRAAPITHLAAGSMETTLT